MIRLLLTLFLIFSIIGKPLFGQKNGKVKQAVESATYYEISFKKIPGLSIGVWYKDSLYFFDYGELKKESGISPDSETIYEISSVTKVFTATLVKILEKEELLKLSDPISKYLDIPDFSFKGVPVTIAHLLNHTSGLPKQPYNFGSREKDPRNPYAYYGREDMKAFLNRFSPSYKPGTKYQYSHFGYALLELIIESATGEGFEQVLKDRILDPLKMESTTLDLNESVLAQIAQGYNIVGEETAPWSFRTYAASLGLKSNTRDMMLFAKACLDKETVVGSVFPAMTNKLISTDIDGVEAGIAWHLTETRRNFPKLILHSGVSDGYRSYIALIPEKDCAVVVLSNSENPTNGLGAYILQYLFNNFKNKEKG